MKRIFFLAALGSLAAAAVNACGTDYGNYEEQKDAGVDGNVGAPADGSTTDGTTNAPGNADGATESGTDAGEDAADATDAGAADAADAADATVVSKPDAGNCGNGLLDPGETCDESTGASCAACPVVACTHSTGSATTCDLKCNVPTTTCSNNDACCPYGCGMATDVDCKGPSWKSVTTDDVTLKAGECLTVKATGIVAGASYAVTTCGPKQAPLGDLDITSFGQSNGAVKPVPFGENAVCDDPNALPAKAGYFCKNTEGTLTMACVSAGAGGFLAKNSNSLVITVCGAGVKGGTAPITLFYNAGTAPIFGAADAGP